ncbi:MAG: hypothetical protein ABIH00_04950 [Armatimonadota bacterium]
MFNFKAVKIITFAFVLMFFSLILPVWAQADLLDNKTAGEEKKLQENTGCSYIINNQDGCLKIEAAGPGEKTVKVFEFKNTGEQFLFHEGAEYKGYKNAFVVFVQKGVLKYIILKAEQVLFEGVLDKGVNNISDNNVKIAESGKYGIYIQWRNNKYQLWKASVNQWYGISDKEKICDKNAVIRIAKGTRNLYRAETDGEILTVTVNDGKGVELNKFNFQPVKPGDFDISTGASYGDYNAGYLIYISNGSLKWTVLTPENIKFSGIFDNNMTSFAVNKVKIVMMKAYDFDCAWTNNKGEVFAGHIDQWAGFKWKRLIRKTAPPEEKPLKNKVNLNEIPPDIQD